jgi:hypothetical protein
MKEFTIRPRMGDKQFQLIEKIVNGKFSAVFKSFMTKYAGLSIEEDCFFDSENKAWIVAAFDEFKSMHNLTKEFKDKGWGLKVPFAYDQGGWHYCLSFDANTCGKIIVNRWTDHSSEDQFLTIADSFESFMNGLKKRPENLN